MLGESQGVRYGNRTSERVTQKVDFVMAESEPDIFKIAYKATECVSLGGRVVRIAAATLVEQRKLGVRGDWRKIIAEARMIVGRSAVDRVYRWPASGYVRGQLDAIGGGHESSFDLPSSTEYANNCTCLLLPRLKRCGDCQL